MTHSWKRFILAAMVLAVLTTIGSADGQELIKVKAARLTFPGLMTIMVDVVKDRGFDRKNGIDLEIFNYSTVSAYYASLAKGEVDFLAGGPHVLQKMRNEGVPIKAISTFVKLSSLSVITPNPEIRSIKDLQGKTIAADMSSSEYQILAIYGRSQGLVFGKDVIVVQAGPPLARAQLVAKRVDAAMTWEVTATMTLRDNPQNRIILNGETAWHAISKGDGWQLLLIANEGFLRRQPQAVMKVLDMFRDGQRFINEYSDEADQIVQRSVGLPAGILKEAASTKRMVYEVLPAWESQKSVIWDMFEVAVKHGYLERLPDAVVIYSP